MKTLLNVGCGHSSISELNGFSETDWKEIRLDIDKDVNPDIVGTLTDMKFVFQKGGFNYYLDNVAIYAEQLTPDDIVGLASKEPSMSRKSLLYFSKMNEGNANNKATEYNVKSTYNYVKFIE